MKRLVMVAERSGNYQVRRFTRGRVIRLVFYGSPAQDLCPHVSAALDELGYFPFGLLTVDQALHLITACLPPGLPSQLHSDGVT